MLALFFLVILPLSLVAGYRAWWRNQVAAATNALKAAGVPVQPSELGALYEPVPPALDTRAYFDAAFLAVKPLPGAKTVGLPLYDNGVALEYDTPMDPAVRARIEEILADNAEVFAQLGAAAAVPRGAYVMVEPGGEVFPRGSASKIFSLLLQLRLALHLQDGNMGEAFETLHTMFQLSAQFRQDPGLAGVSPLTVVGEPLAAFLGTGGATPAQLETLDTVLAAMDMHAAAYPALVAEMMENHSRLVPKHHRSRFQLEDVTWNTARTRKELLEFELEAVAAFRKDEQALYDYWKIQSETVTGMHNGDTPYREFYYRDSAVSIMNRALFGMHLVKLYRAALAVERHRQDRAAFPESLAALAPDYLAAPPLDPETGAPLHFQATAGGFTIYACSDPEIVEWLLSEQQMSRASKFYRGPITGRSFAVRYRANG
ncbi:MAG: hypothetical protein HYV27_04650 [Candidatus Hydrogenedentes bacterium]|nr:hypothetical protein [Candidatus Hydrogenedentota bacterium]